MSFTLTNFRQKNGKKIFENKILYYIYYFAFTSFSSFLTVFSFRSPAMRHPFTMSILMFRWSTHNSHQTISTTPTTVNSLTYFLPFLCSLFVIIKTYLSFRSNITSLFSVLMPNLTKYLEMRIFLFSTSSST